MQEQSRDAAVREHLDAIASDERLGATETQRLQAVRGPLDNRVFLSRW